MKADAQSTPVQQHIRRHVGPYLLAGILLLGSLYLIFRNYRLTEQFKNERQSLIREVQTNQLINDRRQLLLSMKTFVWAVRNAMLQNKSGEINEYFNTLVQNQGVREVLLVDPTGKVTLSTNKKNQGAIFADHFPAALIQQEDVYFTNQQPYQLSAPITSPNKRLGTLVMIYAPTSLFPDTTALN